MNLYNQKTSELEAEIKQQAEYIEFLKDDIEGLKKTKEVLKKWLKEEKIHFNRFVRQGLKITKGNEFFAWHYVVFPVSGIPGTLDILDVKELVQEILKSKLANSKFEKYTIETIDYSERGKLWYVQIGHVIELIKE
ncbi:hypothetical protein MKY20_28490 [Cytobacillus sp. FSL W8-0315]|uniref:hypothetical protein n=1 Tax=Cytobacillus sp. FSL W8-0315 TaxID=2921600 RepID=UPI0030F99901